MKNEIAIFTRSWLNSNERDKFKWKMKLKLKDTRAQNNYHERFDFNWFRWLKRIISCMYTTLWVYLMWHRVIFPHCLCAECGSFISDMLTRNCMRLFECLCFFVHIVVFLCTYIRAPVCFTVTILPNVRFYFKTLATINIFCSDRAKYRRFLLH